MDRATIMLALAGDAGNTIEKYDVTPAEIAVLRVIHGDDAVTNVRKTDEVRRTSREELSRLHGIYSRLDEKGQPDPKSAVTALFPGAAARVFEKLSELDLPDEFYAAERRAVPKSEPAAPEANDTAPKSLDDMTKAELVAFAKDNDIEIDASANKAAVLEQIKSAGEAPMGEAETPAAPDADENDGIGDMPDQELFG